jgi:hypothetical protein
VALPDEETRQLFEGNEIASICAGSDSLFLGSSDGYVSIIGKGWKVIRTFQAHEARITHMRQVEGTSLLVTVAVSSERFLAVYGRSSLVADGHIGRYEQRTGSEGVGVGQVG